MHLTTKIGDTARVERLHRPVASVERHPVGRRRPKPRKYLDKVALTGLVAYGQSNDLDADLYLGPRRSPLLRVG
ncbi:hypothetical protein ACRAWD_09155 [Caulobacter segnis]